MIALYQKVRKGGEGIDYQASDIRKEIANDFVQHKKYKSDTVYWCHYAKKKDFKGGKSINLF